MKKAFKIFVNSIPVLVMIGLIAPVQDDYFLALIYIGIIIFSFKIIKYSKKDVIVFTFGFVLMIIFEYIFVSTGVETFARNSLFGLMPIWLPLLWGYGFVAIKRSLEVL